MTVTVGAIAPAPVREKTMTDIVEFDRPKLERLKKSYLDAVEHNKLFFEFEDKKYERNYAKYLIEYLEFKLAD